MSQKNLNIFDYTDYIEYLNDWFALKREQSPTFSFQVFSNKAGFKSRSYIQFVLKRKRPLALKSLPKIFQALQIKNKEAQYLEAMVIFKENKDHDTKMRYWDVMKKLGKSSKINQLQSKQFEYFKEWYFAPIREIVCQVNFKNDFAFLGRLLLPTVTSKEAREAVQILLKLKLIRKKGSIYEWVDQHIKASEPIQSLAIRNYQKQINSVAQLVHERIPKKERDVSTITLGTDSKGFQKIKTLAKDFRNEIIKVVEESEDIDRVYQINLQIFPLSQILNKI